MSDPIEMLKEEHRKVECVLDGLEAIAEAASVGAFSDRDLLTEILWFLREFTDVSHHAKEEEYLFPALEMRGMPVIGGPTGTMRLEHVKGRQLVSLAGSLLDPAFAPGGPDWKEIALVCDAYARLLRAHIQKENHCVFGIAREILGPTELDLLGEAFHRVDSDWNASHGSEGLARVERILARSKRYVDTLWCKSG
ncbi:MAG: hemerythrin domain-containing protein [Fibrobacteria bacterium]